MKILFLLIAAMFSLSAYSVVQECYDSENPISVARIIHVDKSKAPIFWNFDAKRRMEMHFKLEGGEITEINGAIRYYWYYEDRHFVELTIFNEPYTDPNQRQVFPPYRKASLVFILGGTLMTDSSTYVCRSINVQY